MKYTYFYKTSDGVRHEAAMDAPSREAVFEALRGRGIKAIKVVAADGSKANGDIIVRGVRKRVVALVVALAAIVTGGVAFFLGESNNPTIKQSNNLSAPRHQIYGDPATVANFERGNFEGVFANRGDQMLAWFAQPGKLMCPKDVDPTRMAVEFANAADAIAPIELNDGDSREVRELKQIVNGMHEELSEYLANGNGTPRSFWRRLVQRTQQEMQIYERTRRELENEKRPAVWEEKNEALRRLGLLTIVSQREAD